MTERVRTTVGFQGLPATRGIGPEEYQFESPGFAPAPTSVETLRHIADTISGDGAFIMQGILRKAADELVRWEWLVEHGDELNSPILICYDSETHASMADAIDAARMAK